MTKQPELNPLIKDHNRLDQNINSNEKNNSATLLTPFRKTQSMFLYVGKNTVTWKHGE